MSKNKLMISLLIMGLLTLVVFGEQLIASAYALHLIPQNKSIETYIGLFNKYIKYYLILSAILTLLLSIFKKNLFINLSVIATVYAISITGYNIFVSDQVSHLIPAYKELFANFCPRDYAVWHFTFTHFFFPILIKTLYFITAGHLEIGMFVFWILFLFVFIHGIYCLTRACGGNYSHFLIAILFIGFYSSKGFGGSLMYCHYLHTSYTAFALCLYALAAFISERFFLSFVLLGIASLIHINYGALLSIFMGYTIIRYRTFNIKKNISNLIIFFLIVSPALYFTFNILHGNSNGTSILYNLRNAQMFHPLLFDHKEWFLFIGPFFFASYVLIKRKQKSLIIVMSVFMMVLAGSIIASILEIQSIQKLVIWRISPFPLIISYIIIGQVLLDKEYRWFTTLFFLFFTTMLILKYPFNWLSSLCGLVLTGLFFCGCYLLRAKKFTKRYLMTSIISLILLLGSGPIRGTTILPRIRKINIFYQNGLMSWLKNNTPNDSLILVPPNFEGTRINAHRSIVINFKVASIEGNSLLEWKKRLEVISGVDDLYKLNSCDFYLAKKLTKLYLKHSPQKVKEIMNIYNADYFLTYEKHNNIDNFIADKDFILEYHDTNSYLFKYDK